MTFTNFVGEQNYLSIVNEATWGTLPGSPTYFHLPVDTYSVKLKQDRRKANPMLGLLQEKHGQNWRGMPSGQLVTSMFGFQPPSQTFSLAELLTTWAFSELETLGTLSKSIEYAEGPNVKNKRHLGMRVASATIEGSADTGVITFSADLMGKDEVGQSTVGNAQAIPDDRNKIVEMQFADTVFTLDSVVTLLKKFSLKIDHQLTVEYLNSRRPSLLLAKKSILTFQCVLMAGDDTYDAYNRIATMTELAGSLVIKGLHNGTGATGNYTVGTFTMPRMSFVNAGDEGGRDIAFHPIDFDLLKPDTSGNALTVVWSEAA